MASKKDVSMSDLVILENFSKTLEALRNKEREALFSTSRMVSPAGFETQSQWSRLHTVELAPFRLTSEPTRLPPLAVVGSSPHDLLIRRLVLQAQETQENQRSQPIKIDILQI